MTETPGRHRGYPGLHASRDCYVAKHSTCAGVAGWDSTLDELVRCSCTCHEAAENAPYTTEDTDA